MATNRRSPSKIKMSQSRRTKWKGTYNKQWSEKKPAIHKIFAVYNHTADHGSSQQLNVLCANSYPRSSHSVISTNKQKPETAVFHIVKRDK